MGISGPRSRESDGRCSPPLGNGAFRHWMILGCVVTPSTLLASHMPEQRREIATLNLRTIDPDLKEAAERASAGDQRSITSKVAGEIGVAG